MAILALVFISEDTATIAWREGGGGGGEGGREGEKMAKRVGERESEG